MERKPRRIAGAVACLMLALPAARGAEPRPWALKPVARPRDARRLVLGQPDRRIPGRGPPAKGLTPVGPADKRTLLRRVTFDLTGLPPTPDEQDAFLRDESPDAYESVVDRLLASEQHGVRYGRHWLDVLRYADVDERMIAAPGIHLWRDWVIRALNDDLPYDQFVRAQLTGYRTTERTQMSATGHPEPEGAAARRPCSPSACSPAGPSSATARTPASCRSPPSRRSPSAFMGLTVACAKCHDHMYDPIKPARLLCHEGAVRPAGRAEGDRWRPPPRSSPRGRRSTRPSGSGRRPRARSTR